MLAIAKRKQAWELENSYKLALLCRKFKRQLKTAGRQAWEITDLTVFAVYLLVKFQLAVLRGLINGPKLIRYESPHQLPIEICPRENLKDVVYDVSNRKF